MKSLSFARQYWLIAAIAVILLLGGQHGYEPARSYAQTTNPPDLMTEADDAYFAENWALAWKLYKQLIDDYGKTGFVFQKKNEILEKKRECEQKLGIITDIKDVFKGVAKLEDKGKQKYLSLFYDFEDKDQDDDFVSSASLKIGSGKLLFDAIGRGYSSFSVRGAMFVDTVTIEAKVTILSPSPGEAGFVIFYDTDNGTGYFCCAHYKQFASQLTYDNAIARLSEKDASSLPQAMQQKALPKVDLDKQYTFKAEAKKGKLAFYIDGKKACEVKAKDYNVGRVGFIAYNAKVEVDDLKIYGIVDNEWLNKVFSESTTLALSDEDIKAVSKERTIIRIRTMIAEKDEYMDKVAPRAKELRKEGKKKYNEIFGASEDAIVIVLGGNQLDSFQDDIKEVIKIYDEVIYTDSSFSLAYYDRAKLYEEIDEYEKANADYAAAVRLIPQFSEASIANGIIYRRNRKFDKALEWFDKSIENEPDFAQSYSERGVLHFINSDFAKATKDFDKALELEKDNSTAITYKRSIKHVTEGPKWPVIFTKETTHFIVKTDISQERCNDYADAVEAMFDYYSKMYPLDGPPKRKGMVYIFNTKTAYQVHAALTVDDVMEYTLGYYSPTFRELYLFEEPNRQEKTKKVLYHEGFHQYLHNVTEDAPLWFNEGSAEWFYGTTVSKKRITAKAEMIERLPALQDALQANQVRPLKWLLNATRREFMSGNASQNYAQAWSLVHFLWQFESGKYSKLLKQYYGSLKAGSSAKEAYAVSFGTMKDDDFLKMEDEWRKYTERLR